MEKEERFKIIELPTHQVMVMKDWDEEDSVPKVSVIIFHNGIKLQTGFGYETDAKRDEMYENLNEELGQSLVDGLTSLL